MKKNLISLTEASRNSKIKLESSVYMPVSRKVRHVSESKNNLVHWLISRSWVSIFFLSISLWWTWEPLQVLLTTLKQKCNVLWLFHRKKMSHGVFIPPLIVMNYNLSDKLGLKVCSRSWWCRTGLHFALSIRGKNTHPIEEMYGYWGVGIILCFEKEREITWSCVGRERVLEALKGQGLLEKAKNMIKIYLWNKIKYNYLCISTSLDKVTKMSSVISL